jgi:aminoglycoside 6'-N-acetyltransferase
VSLYRFRPFTRDDLPMMELWLGTPEVVRWWGEPEEQLVLIAGDLDEPRMRQWIVEYDGRPFAYVQAYPVHTWPQPHFAALPAGAVGVDAFIGVPEMIGRGHGGAFLREFSQMRIEQMRIEEGASVIAIDPDIANHRAGRAYARAGFVDAGEADVEGGRVVVMVYRGGTTSP